MEGNVYLAPGTSYAFGKHVDGRRHRIIMWASETGDVPHVAAALVLDPLTDVIVIFNPKDEKQCKDAEAAEKTYRNAISQPVGSKIPVGGDALSNPAARVQMAGLEQTAKLRRYLLPAKPDGGHTPIGMARWNSYFGTARWYSYSDKDREDAVKIVKSKFEYWTYETASSRVEYPTISVGGATSLVAAMFKNKPAQDFYTSLTNALKDKSDKLTDKSIGTWAATKMPPLGAPKKRILLLWSRYSGHNLPVGYNPQGDSDIEGQKQIIKIAADLKFGSVVTIGHGLEPLKGSKDSVQSVPGDYPLSEFWTDVNSPFFGLGRPGQTSFYVWLKNNYDVVQIGQKTGGMDNAALVGIPTVYIEYDGSESKARMKKWADVMPLYKGAIVSKPPSQFGRMRCDDWTISRATAASSPDVSGQKGYAEGDLKIIKQVLSDMCKGVFKDAFDSKLNTFVG